MLWNTAAALYIFSKGYIMEVQGCGAQFNNIMATFEKRMQKIHLAAYKKGDL